LWIRGDEEGVDFSGRGGTDGVEIQEVQWFRDGVCEGNVLRGEVDALGGGEGVARWDDGEEDVCCVDEREVIRIGLD
jgi:hypothetical protein